MFLYRKPDTAVRNNVILRAPRVGASEAAMDTWLHDYAESLDSVAGSERGLHAPGGPKEEATPAPDAVRDHYSWMTNCSEISTWCGSLM